MCELVKYREELFEAKFERIILCQHENLSYRHNETFERMKEDFPNVELVSGLPSVSKLKLDHSKESPALVLIDDLQSEFLSSAEMVHLLSVQVHHFNISVCFSLQASCIHFAFCTISSQQHCSL